MSAQLPDQSCEDHQAFLEMRIRAQKAEAEAERLGETLEEIIGYCSMPGPVEASIIRAKAEDGLGSDETSS